VERDRGSVYQPSERKKTMEFRSKYVRKTVVSRRPGQKVVTKTMEHEKRKRVVDSVASKPNKNWEDEQGFEEMDYDAYDENNFATVGGDDDDDEVEGLWLDGKRNKKRRNGSIRVDDVEVNTKVSRCMLCLSLPSSLTLNSTFSVLLRRRMISGNK
jgi:hypothetical protein